MSMQYDFGYQVLGPVFRLFCYRLRLIEQYKRQTPVLFLSRGGIRLHYFYQQYLGANKLALIAPRHDFYISRMAAFSVLLSLGSRYAAEEIAKEYAFQPIGSVMRFFLPQEEFISWHGGLMAAGEDPAVPVSADYLMKLASGFRPHETSFQSHIARQHDLLVEYFGTLMGAQREAILVDTGWSGSIIKSLQDIFPDVDFTAAFFGRFNYGKPPPRWFDSITGLVMQNEHYNPLKPQSAIVFHRHLIESLCEPAWQSVQYFERRGGIVQPASGIMPERVKAPAAEEAIAGAVRDFIFSKPVTSPEHVVAEYHVAIKRLARILKYPRAQEARLFGVPPRSADFGRDMMVPVLLPVSTTGRRIDRIRQSLWHQGQAALEYGSLRWPFQFAITMTQTDLGAFPQLKQDIRKWWLKLRHRRTQ